MENSKTIKIMYDAVFDRLMNTMIVYISHGNDFC